MSVAWRWISRFIAAGLAAYVVWFALRHLALESLGAAFQRPVVPAAFALAVMAYCLIYPFSGWAWQRLLGRQQVQRPVWPLVRIIALTQLAKYIPGNIAQHASRAAMSVKQGIGWTPYLATAWQEALLSVTASLVVGGLMLALSPAKMTGLPPELGLLSCAIALAVLVLCSERPHALIADSQRLPARLLRKLGRPPGAATATLAIGMYALNYLAVGVAIWSMAAALGLTDTVTFPLATAAFALSWTLGFLAPGAPAGLGAREGVMLLVLQGHGNSKELVLLVLLTRVATLTGDFIAFLAAWWLPAAAEPASSGSTHGQ